MADTPSSPVPVTTAPAKCCTLTKVDIVGSWTLSIATENCSICKTGIASICVECMAQENDTSACKVSEGNCGHHYHTHCIARWTRSESATANSNACPTCQKPWEVAKVHDIAA